MGLISRVSSRTYRLKMSDTDEHNLSDVPPSKRPRRSVRSSRRSLRNTKGSPEKEAVVTATTDDDADTTDTEVLTESENLQENTTTDNEIAAIPEEDEMETNDTKKLPDDANPESSKEEENDNTEIHSAQSLSERFAESRQPKKPSSNDLIKQYNVIIPDYTYTEKDKHRMTDYRSYYSILKPLVRETNVSLASMRQNQFIAAMYREYRNINPLATKEAAPAVSLPAAEKEEKAVPPLKIRLPTRKRKSVGNPDSDTEFEERLKAHEIAQEAAEQAKADRKAKKKKSLRSNPDPTTPVDSVEKFAEGAAAGVEAPEFEKVENEDDQNSGEAGQPIQNFDEHYE